MYIYIDIYKLKENRLSNYEINSLLYFKTYIYLKKILLLTILILTFY